MYVVSTCALPVASWLWQPRASAWALTVICRATFLLRPLESTLAPEQEPPIEDDQHHGDDDRRSLRVASDLAPLKPRADVTLVGHAYAPGGAPVASLIARIRIGEIDKTIEVHSERYFDQDGVLHHGGRFTRMPLVYERAAGGPESWNPVGVRAQQDSYGRVVLPNLQPAGLTIVSAADHIPPIGFGPIPPSWPARRDRLGRHLHGPLPDGQREPLPDDLDVGFYNHAPRDQQISGLRADERIVLENLHPDHPRLVTNLPGIKPRAIIEQPRGSTPLALRCDTLWIDTDRSLCTLTWRAQVPLDSPEEEGRVIFSLDNGGGGQGARVTDTLVPGVSLRNLQPSRILPFGAAGGDPGRPPVSPGTLNLEGGRAQGGSGLPFVGASEGQSAATTTSSRPFAAPPSAPVAPSFGQPPPNAPPAPSFGPPPAPPPPPPPPPPTAPAAPSFGAPPVRVPPPMPSSPSLEPVYPPPRAATMGGDSPYPASHQAPSRPAFWTPPEAPSLASTAAPVMTVGQLAANADLPASPPAAPPPSPSPPPPPAPEKPKAAEAKAESKVEGRRAVQLVWFEGDCLSRVRRKTAWRALLEGIEERSLDADLDDPALAKDPVVVEDRRDVFEVMTRAEAFDEAKLSDAIERGLRDDGKFVHPFLIAAGEIRVPFDELSTLKASISVASPFAPNDEPLKAALEDAQRLLEVRDLSCPPGVYEGFTSRIQEAFRKMRRAAVAQGYLEEAVERALLERRAYQRRDVFGGVYVRTLLTALNGARPWPLYLPDASARKLPMFVRFQARVLVEGWLQEDQFEQHPAALRAFALARVTPMPSLATPKPQEKSKT